MRCLRENLALEVLEIIRDINEYERARVLSELSEYLPENLYPEVLEIIRDIQDESRRAHALSELSAYLPENLYPEVLESVGLFKDLYFSANAISGFLPQLEKLSVHFGTWKKILDVLAYQYRWQLILALLDVRPTIIRLGGDDAFIDIIQSVREVSQQWP